ncbi:hypothetical protein LZ30DRAFT_483372 [Colletotrichum cereale]|nr:hypothetical protein LZ30DRAFT_483372 [Colletotrichum cereale]
MYITVIFHCPISARLTQCIFIFLYALGPLPRPLHAQVLVPFVVFFHLTYPSQPRTHLLVAVRSRTSTWGYFNRPSPLKLQHVSLPKLPLPRHTYTSAEHCPIPPFSLCCPILTCNSFILLPDAASCSRTRPQSLHMAGLPPPPRSGLGSDRARCPQMRLSHSELCLVLLYPAVLPYRRYLSWRTLAHDTEHSKYPPDTCQHCPNTAYRRIVHFCPASSRFPSASLPCPSRGAVSDHFTFPHANLERTVSHRPTSYLIQGRGVPVPQPVAALAPYLSSTHHGHSHREGPFSP